LFGFDQSDIQAAQKPALEALSKQLQQYNLNKIKVVGHTDNIGDPSYNLQALLHILKKQRQY
jgi:outer membrane protein OmpA-like peptidoglycan-associated protein